MALPEPAWHCQTRPNGMLPGAKVKKLPGSRPATFKPKKDQRTIHELSSTKLNPTLHIIFILLHYFHVDLAYNT